MTMLPDSFLAEALQSSRDQVDCKTAMEMAFHKPFYAVIKSGSHLRLFQDGLRSLSEAAPLQHPNNITTPPISFVSDGV